MNLAQFYDERCQKYSTSWDASHWHSQITQENNFSVMLMIGDITENDHILDVGCGQGDFFKYLPCRCEGIEISPKQAEKAKEKFPNVPVSIGDFMDESFTGKWDWLFASGSFNHEGQDVKAAIEKMFKCARKGIGLSILSKFSSLGCPGLKTVNPVTAFKWALELTPFVNINHSNLEQQFVLFMYTPEYAL